MNLKVQILRTEGKSMLLYVMAAAILKSVIQIASQRNAMMTEIEGRQKKIFKIPKNKTEEEPLRTIAEIIHERNFVRSF